MAQIVRFHDRRMNHLLNSPFGSLVRDVLSGTDPFGAAQLAVGNAMRMDFAPNFDMRESAHRYVITADMPGVTSENLDVDVENNVLTITGKREARNTEETETMHHTERAHGSFTRSFRLGQKVDAGNISADLRDGVLSVTLPKTPESTPRKIPVTVNTNS